MSVYEGNRHTRPPSAGDTNVNIISSGQSDRPIVLVFASYEPVNWILNLTAGIAISKVILVSTPKEQNQRNQSRFEVVWVDMCRQAHSKFGPRFKKIAFKKIPPYRNRPTFNTQFNKFSEFQ